MHARETDACPGIAAAHQTPYVRYAEGVSDTSSPFRPSESSAAKGLKAHIIIRTSHGITRLCGSMGLCVPWSK